MSNTPVDFNLLAVLHAVLTAGNVARAAAGLHVTPSAVSNSLARLRDALGDPLFTRRGRGVVPTPRALELQPILARAFEELQRATLGTSFDAETCARAFTLAVADVGQLAWVPRLAREMQRALPRATLRVINIDSLVALGDLASPEVDVHIGVAGRGPGLHAQPLLEVRSVLVARRGHPAPRRKLDARALGALRHVRVEMVPGRNFEDPVTALFARVKASRLVTLSVPSFSTAAEVVAKTDLVCMLPEPVYAARARTLGLRTLTTELPEHRIRFSMSWHDRTDRDQAAQAFRKLVHSAIRSDPARG